MQRSVAAEKGFLALCQTKKMKEGVIVMIVGIDHGYYAIKTKHVSFPSSIIKYDYEPYTMQNVLQYRGKYYVCGTGETDAGKK